MTTTSPIPDMVLDSFARERRLLRMRDPHKTGIARELLTELDHLRAYFPGTFELTIDDQAVGQVVDILHAQVTRIKDELTDG